MQAHRLRRSIGPLFLAAIALTFIAWINKGKLVDPVGIDPALLAEPRHAAVARETFSLEYKGKACRVEPVSEFELWGLVVSHNNIHSVADIYHDSTSVDTKDLCVVWGPNLASDQFQQIEFKSGPWTCYFRYPPGVTFLHDGLGNNHLITDSQAIRDQIDEVRIGDQIRLAGLLVNYQMDDWEGFWRKTSTRRDDTDCEVVFVQELDILERGTPGWYTAYRLGGIAIFALPLLYLFLIWLEAGSADTTTLGRL